MTPNPQSQADDVAELRATVASLEEQLIALYAEKQYGLWPQNGEGGSPDDLQTTIDNLDAMYAAVLEERDALLAQGGADGLRRTIENLDQMYAAMLEERNELLEQGDTAGLRRTIENLDAMYAAMLEERNALLEGGDQATTIANLDAMYCAMLEERNELADSLARTSAHTERTKRRMVDLMSHIVEQEFQTN
jgi:chorismate mutase